MGDLESCDPSSMQLLSPPNYIFPSASGSPTLPVFLPSCSSNFNPFCSPFPSCDGLVQPFTTAMAKCFGTPWLWVCCLFFAQSSEISFSSFFFQRCGLLLMCLWLFRPVLLKESTSDRSLKEKSPVHAGTLLFDKSLTVLENRHKILLKIYWTHKNTSLVQDWKKSVFPVTMKQRV